MLQFGPKDELVGVVSALSGGNHYYRNGVEYDPILDKIAALCSDLVKRVGADNILRDPNNIVRGINAKNIVREIGGDINETNLRVVGVCYCIAVVENLKKILRPQQP
ncbi:uncharacterized protein VTP21DRAFT_2961 [Calcarisporiella thermophila]|uniref:uncharacterized protein n=1 Tax=Calcarisporiella thermophila TaxID=911321 RepID=UPI003743BD81